MIFGFDAAGYGSLLSNCEVQKLLVVAFLVECQIMLLSKPNSGHHREIQQQLAIVDTGQNRWRLVRVIQPLVQVPVDKQLLAQDGHQIG